MVKIVGDLRQASPQLCCALSLSSYIHASASLLHLNDTSTISLQLESHWLQTLSQYWPTATSLANKVDNLIASFAIFKQESATKAAEDLQLAIQNAASDFGLDYE